MRMSDWSSDVCSSDLTNILVLGNATRLIVNANSREVLKTERAIAAGESRLSILAPSGMTEQEKYFARFYSRGQVVVFSRDNVGLGIDRDAEYKVIGVGRDARGRQTVNLVDEHGSTNQWDQRARKRDVSGKRVCVSVVLGGRRCSKKKDKKVQ